jgi:hypothetical protein
MERVVLNILLIFIGMLAGTCFWGVVSILKGGPHHSTCQCPNCMTRFKERRKEAQRKI